MWTSKITNSKFSDWLDDTVVTRFYYPPSAHEIYSISSFIFQKYISCYGKYFSSTGRSVICLTLLTVRIVTDSLVQKSEQGL